MTKSQSLRLAFLFPNSCHIITYCCGFGGHVHLCLVEVHMKNALLIVSLLALIEFSWAAGTDTRTDQSSTTYKTADQQAMNTQRDTDLTRMIRQKIVADDSLSINAHNVKIITENGRVYLRGPVESSAERQQVERLAKGVAGKTQVVNETVISK
jgi:osmotically-inducible protein OsmY